MVPEMMATPRLLATIGISFAGKSTLARELAGALGAELVELDAMAGAAVEDPDDQRGWIERYRLAHARIRMGLDRGEFVVFDAVNHRRHQRDRLRRIASQAGTGIRFVWIDLPVEVALARLHRNRQVPLRQDVPERGFAEIVDAFQPPDGEPDVLTYDGSVPMARWVDHLADALLMPGEMRTDGGLAFRRC